MDEYRAELRTRDTHDIEGRLWMASIEAMQGPLTLEAAACWRAQVEELERRGVEVRAEFQEFPLYGPPRRRRLPG